jgi:hypothetical protein
MSHRGPGPAWQISRGGILKKIEIEVWYAGKKGCPRDRNLREILETHYKVLSFVS